MAHQLTNQWAKKMNIDDLYGQIKEISNSVFSGGAKPSIFSSYIGKYVICRSRNEGINAGVVAAIDSTGVVLHESRRLYYHRPSEKSTCWYEGVAKYGLSNDSKCSTAVEKVIVEDYSLTVCSKSAEASLRGIEDHAQS